ncbi:MAG TPA: MFS transporter [Chthonomonadaceae bacterium]|nr:MFS transporter [Chthonomonadaceae bacterium]
MVADIGRQDTEQNALHKVTVRLIPFLFILYIGAYLDRINLSFAKTSFVKDLHFSDTVFGLGAGIFFLGYFLFEVPSNIIMERTGARIWIARIMITWGIISAAMMFTNSVPVFYLLRFLLGVAEAGFFPGMILYLTYWFPTEERARAISRFMTATPLSGVIGAPLSTWIMAKMPLIARNLPPALAGLRGWQWLFVLEGLPCILLGLVVLLYLTDRPEQAHWLTSEEREALLERLRVDREQKAKKGHFTLKDAFQHPQVLLLSAIYFALQIGFYGFNSWLPSILKEFKSLNEFNANMLSMIPYFCAAVCMMVIGLHSDRTGERRMHVVGSCCLSAFGMALAAYMHSPAMAVLAFTVAAMGLWSTLGPFWALPTAFLSGTAAAGGIAFINSVGNLGGFVGPYTMGALKDKTHSFAVGLLALAGSIFVAGLLSLALQRETSHPPQEGLQNYEERAG